MNSLQEKYNFDLLEKYINNTISKEEFIVFLKNLILNNPLLNFPELPKVEVVELKESCYGEYSLSSNTIRISKHLVDLVLSGEESLLIAVDTVGHEFEHYLQYKFKDSGMENLSKAPNLAESLNSQYLSKEDFDAILYLGFEYFEPEYKQNILAMTPTEKDSFISKIQHNHYLQTQLEKDARIGGLQFSKFMFNYWATSKNATPAIRYWANVVGSKIVFLQQQEDLNQSQENLQIVTDFENQLKRIPLDILVKIGRDIQNINISNGDKVDESLKEERKMLLSAFKKCVWTIFANQPQEMFDKYFYNAFQNDDYFMIDTLGQLISHKKETNAIKEIQTRIIPILKSDTITSCKFYADYTRLLTMDQYYDIVSSNLKESRPRFCSAMIKNCSKSFYSNFTTSEKDSFEREISHEFIRSVENFIKNLESNAEDLIFYNFYEYRVIGDLLDSRESVKQIMADLNQHERELNEYAQHRPQYVHNQNFIRAYGQKEFFKTFSK